jgi:hypothetical protein
MHKFGSLPKVFERKAMPSAPLETDNLVMSYPRPSAANGISPRNKCGLLQVGS